MQCYAALIQVPRWTFMGLLAMKGETRCLGGVGVYWSSIETYHVCPRHSERHTEIIDLLQLLNPCAKQLKSHECDIKIFPRLRGSLKVCLTQSADLSVFVLFLLSYFSLQPPVCCDFSIISQPISMKFGMLLVLDETNRLNIFSSQYDQGSGLGVVPKFYYA